MVGQRRGQAVAPEGRFRGYLSGPCGATLARPVRIRKRGLKNRGENKNLQNTLLTVQSSMMTVESTRGAKWHLTSLIGILVRYFPSGCPCWFSGPFL